MILKEFNFDPSKMFILFDIDDVTAETGRYALGEEVYQSLWNRCKEEGFLEGEEWKRMLITYDEVATDPRTLREIEPNAAIGQIITNLKPYVNIGFVTGRPATPENVTATKGWLRERVSDFGVLGFTEHQSKWPIIKKYSVASVVDDLPKYIDEIELRPEGPWSVHLVNRPWNRGELPESLVAQRKNGYRVTVVDEQLYGLERSIKETLRREGR